MQKILAFHPLLAESVVPGGGGGVRAPRKVGETKIRVKVRVLTIMNLESHVLTRVIPINFAGVCASPWGSMTV